MRPLAHALRFKTPDGVEPILALPTDLLRARSVAVIRTSGLGDVIMLTAALHHLAWAYPHLAIDLYTADAYVDLLSSDPLLRGVYARSEYTKHTRRLYDIVFNCEMIVEKSPAGRMIDRVTLFGYKLMGEKPDCPPQVFLRHPTRDEQRAVEELLTKQEKRVAIAPWSARHYADWPHAQALVDLLLKEGVTPYIVDNRDDRLESISGAIPVKLGLVSLAYFLSECDALVAVDSGILHLAAAVQPRKARIVGLFGPVAPGLRITYYENVVPFYAQPDCNCYGGGCSMEQNCMHAIAAADVLQAISPKVLQGAAQNAESPL